MHGVKPQHILEAKEINARLVFDLVYNPVDTPFLRMARQKGIPAVTGVEMFVQQGARQFEIWTGKTGAGGRNAAASSSTLCGNGRKTSAAEAGAALGFLFGQGCAVLDQPSWPEPSP